MSDAFHRAFVEATELGHQWVGPEHLLLALLAGAPDSQARQVLEDFGITRDSYRKRFEGSLLNAEPPVRSDVAQGPVAQAAPIFYEIIGWIRGYRAAVGPVDDDDATLLALAWTLRNPLDRGVDRAPVVAALGERGVPTPVGLPPVDLMFGERIDVPQESLQSVIEGLEQIDSLLGFNTDPENGKAWVSIPDGDAKARSLVERLSQ